MSQAQKSNVKRIALYLGIIMPFICFLLVSFRPASNEKNNAFTKTITGEDLFRAVYFNQGELVYRLDVLAKAITIDQNLSIENKWLTENAIEKIKKIEPSYFSQFKKEVTSGDRVRIKNMLTKTNELSVKVLSDNNYSNNIKSQNNTCVVVYCDQTIIPILIPIYVIATNNGSASKNKIDSNFSLIKSNQFYLEQLVNELAETLNNSVN